MLRDAVPLMPTTEVTTAQLTLPNVSSSTTYGLALQNIESVDAATTLDLVDSNGAILSSAQVAVPASRFIVRELGELFGFAPASGSVVRVSSNAPIQVLGVAADQANGTAAPIVAR